ncbi:MAG: bifunctional 4-hydroxy-2-oxoglutarate aldolase/2-dehydro-3-deoxy-phosphogluconate aldolase [Trueperaceae bacterium]
MNSIQVTAERVKETGIIAIVRGDYSESQVVTIAETLARTGIFALEVTLNSRDALRHLELLRKRFPDLLIGAGTVRESAEATSAIAAGAQFLVSPNFDRDSVSLSLQAGVLHLPGVFTATEAQTAYAHGCHLVKLFPADVNGPSYLKALRAPLDRIGFVPTGGITPDNLGDYVTAGAVALGAGSALVGAPGQDPAELAARAKAFVSTLASARSANRPR